MTKRWLSQSPLRLLVGFVSVYIFLALTQAFAAGLGFERLFPEHPERLLQLFIHQQARGFIVKWEAQRLSHKSHHLTYLLATPVSPFSVFTASFPISVPSSVWFPIPFSIFIATAKLAIVVSWTLAALSAHGARESLSPKSRRKPATHPWFPRHAGRRSHHWMKWLGWICNVTIETITKALLIIHKRIMETQNGHYKTAWTTNRPDGLMFLK